MAAAEAATDALGPRFAPDDPTLPGPWKGLIDGSTGLLYYWNQETNVTQYERPVESSTTSTTPAPIPQPSNAGAPAQASQQVMQAPQQQMQYQNQYPNNVSANSTVSGALQQPAGQPMAKPEQEMYNGPMGGQQMPPQQTAYLTSMPYQQGSPYMQGQTMQRPWGPHQHLYQYGQGSWVPPPQNAQQRPQISQQAGFPKPEEGAAYDASQQLGFGAPQINSSLVGGTHPSVQPNQPLGGFAGPNQTPQVGLNGEDQMRRIAGGSDFYPQNMYPSQQPKLAPIPQGRPDARGAQSFGPRGPTGGFSNHSQIGPSAAASMMYNNGAFPNTGGMGASSDFSSADAYRQHHEVTATGENVPPPFMTFESTGFPPEILHEIHMAGFETPTPIQAQTWSIALQSRDIVAIAKTGSGKTLGYLIPAFMHLRRCRNNPQMGPTVLVLAPTRELATQIQDEAVKFGRSSRISCTCLYGGAPKGPQLKELDRGADIVVATPGRLNDIIDMGRIKLRQVSFLVLDEADRMLDMGFEPQIRRVVNEMPPRRQTLMYTATWPKDVRKIAADLLRNPVQVNIGNVDELAANKSITQYVEVLGQMEKQRRLEQILSAQERGSKVIIFCSTKKLCDQLARGIGRSFGAVAIHGDKSQAERDHVLQQFRDGRAPILVATDVAARGLDIKDIRVVINYDFPTGVEDYVHRIGRTGRAGATGVAYTFFSDQDWKYAADLVKVLEGANQQVPPQLGEIAAQGAPPRGGPRDYPGSFPGRGGPGQGGFGGRSGGPGPGGFGGRGSGYGGSPGGYGGRGGGRGRGDFQGGRGGSRGGGRGFRGGAGAGRGRLEQGPQDRYGSDGRGRYDDRRRGRERSYSPSPSRGRASGYGRDSRSRSRSRSRSWSRSRSRSRSWSRSRSRSGSRSRSPIYDQPRRPRVSGFDIAPAAGAAAAVMPVPAVPAQVPATGAGHVINGNSAALNSLQEPDI